MALDFFLGTVLANEEIIDGLSERGNHPVVRMPLRQWVLKITKYADKLENGLIGLQWPEGTMSSQKQWIGRSEGANIRFPIDNFGTEFIEVFTTRPDTVMGVTYLVVAPENPIVSQLTSSDQKEAVGEYLADVAKKSDLERTSTGKNRGKTGVFLGSYAVHPLSGERIPIWTADYVLAGYGSGAAMAAPAHDDRDFEFASIFNLPIRRVVSAPKNENAELPMIEDGVACNSGEFDNLPTTDCKKAVISALEKRDQGHAHVSYKLRDWVFSRQRYWGEPIPIYFPVEMLTQDGKGSPIDDAPHRICYDNPIPVDEADLPLKLPEMENFQVTSYPYPQSLFCLRNVIIKRLASSHNHHINNYANGNPCNLYSATMCM